MDVRKYLIQEFVDIRQTSSYGLSHDWPNQNAISSLVERASGRFIYPSTVIRYIRSSQHRPDDRLEVILRPQEGDQLDALYALFFKDVESDQLEQICLVFGILYFQKIRLGFFSDARPTIEHLLEMNPEDLDLLLAPILSLIAEGGNHSRILHIVIPLFDYLLDSTRKGHLPLDFARVHEVVATYILTNMISQGVYGAYLFHRSRPYPNSPLAEDLGTFGDFAFHCQYAHLNDTLKSYLNDTVAVPCPTSIMTSSATIPPWDDGLNMTQRQLIWCFLRTLSREVCVQ
jgi:hypothetical protein